MAIVTIGKNQHAANDAISTRWNRSADASASLSVVFGVGIVVSATPSLVSSSSSCSTTLSISRPCRASACCAIALVALGYAMVRWIVKPLLAKLSLTDVASRLEAAFPQFDDRLRSTVDFISGKVPGSDMMQARVVDETTTLAGTLNLDAAIVTRPVWYSATSGIGAMLLFDVARASVTPQFRNHRASRDCSSPSAARSGPRLCRSI